MKNIFYILLMNNKIKWKIYAKHIPKCTLIYGSEEITDKIIFHGGCLECSSHIIILLKEDVLNVDILEQIGLKKIYQFKP